MLKYKKDNKKYICRNEGFGLIFTGDINTEETNLIPVEIETLINPMGDFDSCICFWHPVDLFSLVNTAIKAVECKGEENDYFCWEAFGDSYRKVFRYRPDSGVYFEIIKESILGMTTMEDYYSLLISIQDKDPECEDIYHKCVFIPKLEEYDMINLIMCVGSFVKDNYDEAAAEEIASQLFSAERWAEGSEIKNFTERFEKFCENYEHEIF